jgi:hypothetical protein
MLKCEILTPGVRFRITEVEKMDERLLAAALVAPFFICMVGFAFVIAFAPAVPNEIASATEHDHEEMD